MKIFVLLGKTHSGCEHVHTFLSNNKYIHCCTASETNFYDGIYAMYASIARYKQLRAKYGDDVVPIYICPPDLVQLKRGLSYTSATDEDYSKLCSTFLSDTGSMNEAVADGTLNDAVRFDQDNVMATSAAVLNYILEVLAGGNTDEE